MPIRVPDTMNRIPARRKNLKGSYIINTRNIVMIERFIYAGMLFKSLDGRRSSFVLTGTDVMAMFFMPACIIVSMVYV